jgi:hypothetical protein
MNWNRNPRVASLSGANECVRPYTSLGTVRRETNYVGRLSLSVAVALAGCKLSLVIS